ncbi:MAG: SDR family oxidoreductase [Ignavibacteria bacterium]
MKYLITGGAGYIGVPLINHLLNKGNSIVCLDRFFFGKESLSKLIGNPKLCLVKEDIRRFDPSLLQGIDVVIDLASLSNDPSSDINPVKTFDINYLGRVRVAKLSKEYGVKRYILASTCSVYGFHDQILTEESKTNPLTTYSKSAVRAEEDVLSLGDDTFTVVVPRFATVYGLAPRMRFDLVINAMILRLQQTGKLSVMRDGTQWRPFIHVKDVARAYEFLAESDPEKVNKEIFNVGSNEQNYQIFPLAQLLGNSFGKPYEIVWYGDPDLRSYRVNFDKISRLGFKTIYTPEFASKEIYQGLEKGEIKDELKTRTVEWYKHLLSIEELINDVKLKDTIL